MSRYKDNILYGDALQVLKTIPDQTAQICVTSPPYWGLRDYGVDGQIGLEETPEEYVEKLTNVFREVRRVLKDDGTLWLNLGDSYCGSNSTKDSVTNKNCISAHAGHTKGGVSKSVNSSVDGLKPKDLVGIPWRVAFALQSDGWYLRSDIIWHKPNPIPEPVKDRPTKAHEYLFLLSKSDRYYYDWEAIAEEANYDGRNDTKHNGSEKYANLDIPCGKPKSLARGQRERWPNKNEYGTRIKNKRSVWTIKTKPYPEAHYAVYPPELIAPCIKAGSKPYDIVLDPFFGSGTTGEVCQRLNRHYLGIELNEDYEDLQRKRLNQPTLKFK